MPVCVHADPSVRPQDLVRLRKSSAMAWSLVVETLRMPRPSSDGPLGGDPRLDIYVVPRAPGEDALRVGRDALDRLEDRDSSPAFLLIDPELVARGTCALDTTMARGIVRASAMGLDAGETENVVDGFARHIGDLVAPCGEERASLVDAVKQRPFRAVTTVAGSFSLARYLDRERGFGYGAIVPGLLSMAVQRRGIVIPKLGDDDEEIGAAHFQNETSVFDVLAATLGDQGSSFDDLLLDAAVERACDPSNKPMLEWRIPASTVPRRLAISRGIEATGATYVQIDLDKTPKPISIELDLKWEVGARFRWTVLKLDASGKRIGEVPVAALDRKIEVTVEVRRLEATASLLVVGINGGDPLKPWHADDPQGLPHGYEIGIYEGTP